MWCLCCLRGEMSFFFQCFSTRDLCGFEPPNWQILKSGKTGIKKLVRSIGDQKSHIPKGWHVRGMVVFICFYLPLQIQHEKKWELCGVEPLNRSETDMFFLLKKNDAPVPPKKNKASPKKVPNISIQENIRFHHQRFGMPTFRDAFLNTSSLQSLMGWKLYCNYSLMGRTFWQSHALPMKDLPLSPVRQKKQSPCRRFRRSSRRRSSRRRCFGAPQNRGSFFSLGLGKVSEVGKIVVLSSLCMFHFLLHLVTVKSILAILLQKSL